MTDNMQAQPPPVHPTRPPSYKDRYTAISIGKLQERRPTWHWLMLAVLAVGVGVLTLLACYCYPRASESDVISITVQPPVPAKG
jgi:hypothetical protein